MQQLCLTDTLLCLYPGNIDRNKLAALVFSNKAQRTKLNRLTHPAVLLEIMRQLLLLWLAHHWLVVGSLWHEKLDKGARASACIQLGSSHQISLLTCTGGCCVAVQVIDMPLLFETKAYKVMQSLVVVTCTESIQVR